MKHALFGHEDADRDRGVLSPADREFLVTGGENLNSEQSRRNTRRRIRNRIRNAIIDFDIIARLLSDEDRALVFDEDEKWDLPFKAGQKSMIEFLYAGLEESDTEIGFETVLRSGVHDAELEKRNTPAQIDVEFDVQTNIHFDLDDAKQRFEEGASLTVAEIGSLLATGVVTDADDIEQLVEHAQQKGVVESSISPMHAAHIAEMHGAMSPTDFDGGVIHLPVDAFSDNEGDVSKLVRRSESMALLEARYKNDSDDVGEVEDETEE